MDLRFTFTLEIFFFRSTQRILQLMFYFEKSNKLGTKNVCAQTFIKKELARSYYRAETLAEVNY